MALTDKYLITTKNLGSIINSLITARAPERFTNKFLEDLGFKSTNDRLYIGIFKALGLIDDNGIPTERYYKFLDQGETYKILAIGIQEAYEDLFNLKKDAQTMSQEDVKNKLKTLTQGQRSDDVLARMAKTFTELCSIADWTKTQEVSKSIDEKVSQEKREQNIGTIESTCQQEIAMNLHYNIQIHLPETTNMAVYDAIFQSMKKHLK